MTTTTVQLPPVSAPKHHIPVPVTTPFIAAQNLGTVDVEAWFAPVDRVQCRWCSRSGHETSVQVYGWPREDLTDPITCVSCCQCCASDVIDLARSEQAEGDDRDIRVEFGYADQVTV
jgi:hypothetical protein